MVFARNKRLSEEASWAKGEVMTMQEEALQSQVQHVILCSQARQVTWTRLWSWSAFLRMYREKKGPPSMAVAAASSAESQGGRTRFESNRHGVYDSADCRPDFLRQFDLGLIGVTRDHR